MNLLEFLSEKRGCGTDYLKIWLSPIFPHPSRIPTNHQDLQSSLEWKTDSESSHPGSHFLSHHECSRWTSIECVSTIFTILTFQQEWKISFSICDLSPWQDQWAVPGRSGEGAKYINTFKPVAEKMRRRHTICPARATVVIDAIGRPSEVSLKAAWADAGLQYKNINKDLWQLCQDHTRNFFVLPI